MQPIRHFLTEAMDDLEPSYRVHYLAADARQTIVAIVIWLAPAILFAYADYLIFGWGPTFAASAAVRLAFCVVSLYTIAALRKVATPEEYDRIFLRWAASAIAAVLYLNYSWASYVPPNGAITVLILFSAYMVFPNRLGIRLIPPLVLSVGNLLLQFVVQPINPKSLLTMIVALIMANVLGIIFSTWLQNHRLTEFRARREEARVREELYRLASIDDLTGILNRRKLMQLAAEEFAQAKREKRPLSVLMIDIDHFKRLNDSCGHEAGDLILTDFTAYVTARLAQKGIWGRLGGDEFVLVLAGFGCGQAGLIAEQLRRGFEAKSRPRQTTGPSFTISIGVTEVRARDKTFDDILKRADKALYRAKRNGRNRTEIS
jgi:diguanylate cyclase (GGDEF)-like protein